MALAPGGRRAVSGGWDRTLRVWDLESGQTVRTLEGHTSVVNAVAITPDGNRIISASWDRTLRLWNLESGKTVRILKGHTDGVTAVAITTDGRRAVSASYDCTLRVWDLETGEEITAFTGERRMFRCAIAPDGQTITSGDEFGRVHFLRLEEAE